MKTFKQLLYLYNKRSLNNFHPTFNMITSLPDSVLAYIDTFNGCNDKYNFLVTCRTTYQTLLKEPNAEYRNHFIPKKMLKMSFVPLKTPSHCLLPSPAKNQVTNGYMVRGMLSLSHACFNCCHYLPFSALMFPTMYDCFMEKTTYKPMPLDHKCFYNRYESSTTLQAMKSTRIFQPDDSPIVSEIFRFEMKDSTNYNKSVVTICDEGCLNTLHDTIELGIGSERHVATAVVSHKIIKVIRHSEDLGIIKFRVTFFITPELELRCSFLSSSNILDSYSIGLNKSKNSGVKPFFKTFTSYVFVDPHDEDITTVSELYNVAVLHQREHSYSRLDIHSPYIYMGMYSLSPSLRGPREEKLDIISIYDDDGESYYPLMVINGNHQYEELRYHYHTTFSNILPPKLLGSFFPEALNDEYFGGSDCWTANITVCKHNVHEIFYNAVMQNLRDHIFIHYGLSCIDNAVIRISESCFMFLHIPHMQCDELLSTDSEYNNSTDEEYSESEFDWEGSYNTREYEGDPSDSD